MRHYWLSLLTVLSAVSLGNPATPPAPLWSDIRVKHMWNTVPENWESLGPPPTNTTIDLYIALKPHHENALTDALYEVSSPGHQKYGAHLSKEQVAELVAPRQDTLEAVYSWLEHHGVPTSSISTSHGSGWLKIIGVPVFQADELLCASYQLYRHTGTNETEVILRTVSYGLPVALHAHVETVAPTTFFTSQRTLMPTSRKSEVAGMVNETSGELVRVLSRRENEVTPSILRSLYGTTAYEPAMVGHNALGIVGFENQYASHRDLTAFMGACRRDAAAATFTVKEVNGGVNDEDKPREEASLNIQYAGAMAFPIPQIFYSTGGNIRWSDNQPVPGDSYHELLNYLLGLPDTVIPRTISISYISPEPTLPPDYAKTICNLFKRLGVRGVSILVASGDEGVGSAKGSDNPSPVPFIPTFPASCPFVTSVGATIARDPEVAIPLSGGGFSWYFTREDHQKAAVSTFLDTLGDKYDGLYNPEGRGIPDISAQGHQYLFVCGATALFVSGTSCSTPTVAGIVALLTDYRLSIGKRPLGFLNPWLYGRGKNGLTDITSGSNPGCNTEGFTSTTGWDPVTGLGTPRFGDLQLHLPLDVPVPVT